MNKASNINSITTTKNIIYLFRIQNLKELNIKMTTNLNNDQSPNRNTPLNLRVTKNFSFKKHLCINYLAIPSHGKLQ